MSPILDKRGTRINLVPEVDQNPTVPPSPPQIPQKDEAIKLPNKRKHSPLRDPPEKGLNHGQGSLLETPKSEAHRPLGVKHESPWDSYKKEFSCELAGDAVAVIHRRQPSQVLLLRSYPEGIADMMFQWFTQLRHPNIMSAKECFSTKNLFYALCEDLPLTLENLIICRAYPTEARLALIMRQVHTFVYFLSRHH